jgi:hypothetical protein
MAPLANALRTAGRRMTVAAPQQRKMSNMVSTFLKDCGREETWSWLVGMAFTGVIIWKITPSSNSEYAKNSKFQKRCNGENVHEHH